MFLVSLNYFRAIAIIIIVAGHCYDIAGINISTLTYGEKIAVNLITGGTALFVFISGFLFHHIFIPRYQYKKFMIGKVKNVLIPYLILSIPVILLYLQGQGEAPYFVSGATGVIDRYIIPTIKYYWSGSTVIAYWYIPFIMITFSMAPLHIKFARLNTNMQLAIIAPFLAISAILHRPIYNLYVLQEVLYFFPVYLIGIFCSIHKEKIYDLMTGKEIYLILTVLSLAIFEASIGMQGNYHKSAFSFNGIDIMLFQKLTLSLFFMVWLHRFEKTSIKILEIIAATSFSIFFLHGYLISLTKREFHHLGISSLNAFTKTLYLSSWLNLALIVVTFVTISSLIAISLKKWIPEYSRYLTGY
jgi:hypothetical protein